MWEGKKKIAWSMRSKDNERTACKPLVLKLIPITFHKEQFKKICLQNFALEKAAWELCSRIPMFMHAWLLLCTFLYIEIIFVDNWSLDGYVNFQLLRLV